MSGTLTYLSHRDKAVLSDPAQTLEVELDYRMIELLFFAYRDFVGDADAVLARDNLGRAHHRVLHFVMRHPGIGVAELLDILRITKQSLGPILRRLTEAGLLEARANVRDRRQRLLHLTEKGRDLALQLTAIQSRRVGRALSEAGDEPAIRRAVEAFLTAMIEPEARDHVALAGIGS